MLKSKKALSVLWGFVAALLVLNIWLGVHLLYLKNRARERAENAQTPAPTEITPVPSIEPSAQPENWYRVWTDDAAVFQNSTGAETLGNTRRGSRLTVSMCRDGRALVILPNGTEGWVYEWCLIAEDEMLAREDADRAYAALLETTGLRPVAKVPDPTASTQETPLYYAIVSELPCYTAPDDSLEAVYFLKYDERVKIHGQKGAFYLIELENGKCCFCSIDGLLADIPYVQYQNAVDLRKYLPGAEFDLLFASPNNVTGQSLYAAVPLMEMKTAQMLKEAYKQFRQDGYTIKICDAYRPASAQEALFAVVGDSNYIANPANGGSWHQLGRAIDMTLVNLETGEELKMPSPMHTFARESMRTQRANWTQQVTQNVDYMTRVMTDAGFGIISTEWWHYENTGAGTMLDRNIDLLALCINAANVQNNAG